MRDFIYSGEIHYFRIPVDLWEKILKKAKDSNLNTISTYIPWVWHEQKKGKFDFEGKTHPQKNVLLFLDKAKKFNLKIIARIGPVSNAELKNEGLPEWLLKENPEILNIGKGIENLPHTILLNYLHPVFLKYVRNWHKKILTILARYRKNISLIQPDNEIGMSHWVNKTPELSQLTEKKFVEFLKRKYRRISELNREFQTRYKSFSQINQTKTYGNLAALSCLQEFYQIYFRDYFLHLKKTVRRFFPKKTILINIPQFIDFDTRARGFDAPSATYLFGKFASAEKNIVFGGAYQLRKIDYENFHDIFIATELINMINRNEKNICAELQTGVMRDRPKIYPEDAEFHLKTALASGLKGVNCYMFAGGENPDNIGMFGRYHEWQTPVDSKGRNRKHIEPIKDTGLFLKSFGKFLFEAKKENQTTLGFYPPYYANCFSRIPSIESARNRYFFDGIARLLILNNIQFNFVDLKKEKLAPLPHIWVFSWNWMDGKTQEKILNYVKNGGKIVIGPNLPETFLKGIGVTKKIKKGNSIVFCGDIECFAEEKTEIYSGKFDKVLAKNREGKTAAFITKFGKGTILAYGFPLTHNYDYQTEIVKKWTEILDIIPPMKTNSKEVIFAIHRSNREGKLIFALNYHNIPVKADFQIESLSFSVDFAPRQIKILPFNLKLSKKLKILFSTASVSDFRKGHLLLLGRKGETGILKFERNGKRKTRKFKFNREKIWLKIL